MYTCMRVCVENLNEELIAKMIVYLLLNRRYSMINYVKIKHTIEVKQKKKKKKKNLLLFR